MLWMYIDYVNVYGWCEEDEKCDDKCTCSPCSHLGNVSYGVLVNYDSRTPSLSSAGVEDCSSKDLGSCPQTCSSDVNGGSSDDDDDDTLSADDIAGLTVGVACGVVFFIVLIYFCRQHYGKVCQIDLLHLLGFYITVLWCCAIRMRKASRQLFSLPQLMKNANTFLDMLPPMN